MLLSDKEKKKILVAKINADIHRGVGAKFPIKGYPTLYLLVKGSDPIPLPDNAPRTADGMAKFISEKTSNMRLL
jgi:hypothetical protein